MAFDSQTRNKLQRMVGACRRLLADEFDDQLQRLYGIYAQDGRVLELEKLTTLDDDDYQIATLLRDRVKHLTSGMASEKQPLAEAVRRVLRDDLASGSAPQVLLTTPESLEVLMFRKDAALAGVRAVVIDEVHLLYNSQRGLQLSCLLKRLRGIASELQWAALSATVGRLSDVRDFLFGTAEPAVFLEFPAHRPIDALVSATYLKRPQKQLMFLSSRKVGHIGLDPCKSRSCATDPRKRGGRVP